MTQQKAEQSELRYLFTIAAILLTCFIVTTIALIFVWGVTALARGPIETLHTSLFGISAHEFDLFLYGFLTLIKCLSVVLFLFPWVAIRYYLFTQVSQPR